MKQIKRPLAYVGRKKNLIWDILFAIKTKALLTKYVLLTCSCTQGFSHTDILSLLYFLSILCAPWRWETVRLMSKTVLQSSAWLCTVVNLSYEIYVSVSGVKCPLFWFSNKCWSCSHKHLGLWKNTGKTACHLKTYNVLSLQTSVKINKRLKVAWVCSREYIHFNWCVGNGQFIVTKY